MDWITQLTTTYPLIASGVIAMSSILTVILAKRAQYVKQRRQGRRKIQRDKQLEAQSEVPVEEIKKQLDPLQHAHYWYTVCLSEELTQDKPLGIHLLNEPLCLYRNAEGNVVCVLDKCPHRSAPLSLGRKTKQGTLECLYHGFEFGDNGQCVRIPTVSKTSKAASLICAKHKMTHEEVGFVWVWAGPNELAHLDLIPRFLFKESVDKSFGDHLCDDTTYDLPVSYDLVQDNLLDYAHINWTHDGYIGKREWAACTTCTEVEKSPYTDWNPYCKVFKLALPEGDPRNGGEISKEPRTEIVFTPPCFGRMEHDFENGRKFVQVFINLPTETKRMKLISRFYRNFFNPYLLENIPGVQWYMDRMNQKIVDQDLEMLTGIQKYYSEHGAPILGNIVSADLPIKAFRKFQFEAVKKFGTVYYKGWHKKKLQSSERVEQQGNSKDVDDIEDCY